MKALTTSARPRIGWGLIGAGGISDQLARALSHVPEARLVAVGSRDVAKAQAFIAQPREHETIHEPVRAHGSYQALVDDPEGSGSSASARARGAKRKGRRGW